MTETAEHCDLGALENVSEGDLTEVDLGANGHCDLPPVVVVEGIEPETWAHNTPPRVCVTRWGHSSGPSSGTCSPTSRSASLVSVWSDASWSDGVMTPGDARSLSSASLVPKGGRARHASTSLTVTQGSATKKLADTRLCASQELIGTEGHAKQKHSLKSMFLDVFHPESSRRTRSASSGEVRHRSPSAGDSKMRKFLSKIRSHSQSDLMDVRVRRSSTSSLDLESMNEGKISLHPKVKGHSFDNEEVVPVAAINTHLVGRYRKNNEGKKRRWSVFEHQLLRSRGTRQDQTLEPSNGGHYESDAEEQDSYVINLQVPEESSTDAVEKMKFAKQHHSKRALGRTRSNSDSTITVIEKKRKKGILSRDMKMIDRLLDFRHKRHKLRGSMPSLVVEGQPLENEAQQTNKKHRRREKSIGGHSSHDNLALPIETSPLASSERSRAQSFHNLTDFAVEDYFSLDSDRRFSEDNVDSYHNLVQQKNKENVSHFLEEPHRSHRHRFSIDNIWNALRGKSRSVDHTIHSPFDLDTLRRKIGERTSSEPSRDIPSPSPDPVDGSKENISPSEKKMGGRSQPSQPSITYTVSANDTLTSIAARFDTTPSELTKLNRLSTRFLFPGQILVVPDKSGTQDDKGGGDQLLQEDRNGQDLLTDARPITPTQRGEMKTPLSPHNYPRTPANSVEVEKSLDRECLEKFLKISVRHITDGQGVVAGVLLVTPNAIMFDPNVSDPLVIEHGPESYGVIAPMEYVVNGALFHDIAHMRVKDTNLPKPEIPKPEIYWGPGHGDQTGSQESPGKDASLSKDATFPELAASQDDNDSSCSCGGDTRESSAFPKAFEHELLTPIGSDVSPASGDGQSSPAQPSPSVHQQPTAPVAGDLTPIAEAGRSEDSQATTPNLAQTQCDSVAAQDLAQINLTSAALQTTEMAEESVCNDKKRTTSVTFDLTGEEEIIPDVAGEGIMQESRKQKVLKRLSYPLSWMESFSTDKENLPQHQNVTPSSAPAVSTSANAIPTDCPDATKAGMFSNVFSMSNVSNMLSRRPSLDFARRPGNQQPLSGMTQGMVHPTVPVVPVSTLQPEHQTVAPTANVMTSLQNQQAQKRAQYKEGPKFGLKSMVSMDDMPELFASFDKLIPKPATSCEDPPLYLCLRMGKPAVKSIPKSTPVMSYGKKRMRPEYWFSIPRNRVDELYNFFQLWAHDIYGELNEEEVVARGFVLVEEDTELWDDDGHEGGEGGDLIGGELTEMTKESWEVVSMSEELRRALYSSGSLTSLDLEVFLPDINGTTEIITDQVRKNLYKKLPARAQGYSWKLVFSTAQNGFSLNSLYRKMSDVDSPIMVFIQDTHQNVFGAVVSCSLHVSELFYGTGESFLFSFHPEFQVFPWTGENTFFVKGNNESLVIGGGDGNFGLWLDGDLYQGRTQPCKTFNNPQLTDTEDFIIKTIECWCFE